MNINELVDLARQGGKLSSDKQWVLADELAPLTKTEIGLISSMSGRNESTLLQYARASQRWSPTDLRIEGVTFSAHRVALSANDPRALLLDLKARFGSPTVRQVREAMGLEGHISLEHGRKMLKTLNNKVPALGVRKIRDELDKWLASVDRVPDPDVDNAYPPTPYTPEPEPVDIPEEAETTDYAPTTWQPAIRTNDIAGL